MKTNGEMIRAGETPCEWNPYTDDIAYTFDPYHARAAVAIGQTSKVSAADDRRLRVCARCAERSSAIAYAKLPGGSRVMRRPLGEVDRPSLAKS